MPVLQGHMEGTGWVVSVQGAKKETINHHCDVQTRPGSHGWVRGVMEVTRIRCGSIISFINKMTGTVDVYIVHAHGANVFQQSSKHMLMKDSIENAVRTA